MRLAEHERGHLLCRFFLECRYGVRVPAARAGKPSSGATSRRRADTRWASWTGPPLTRFGSRPGTAQRSSGRWYGGPPNGREGRCSQVRERLGVRPRGRCASLSERPPASGKVSVAWRALLFQNARTPRLPLFHRPLSPLSRSALIRSSSSRCRASRMPPTAASAVISPPMIRYS